MDEMVDDETLVEPVAAPSAPNAMADDDDIVAKYGLENYDDEPGSYRLEELRNWHISAKPTFFPIFASFSSLLTPSFVQREINGEQARLL